MILSTPTADAQPAGTAAADRQPESRQKYSHHSSLPQVKVSRDLPTFKYSGGYEYHAISAVLLRDKAYTPHFILIGNDIHFSFFAFASHIPDYQT